MIWFTSDLHFGHDREFIWGARGYTSVDEMNDIQIAKWNLLINEDDDVYVLGDLSLGSHNNILEFIPKLKGKMKPTSWFHNSTSLLINISLLLKFIMLYLLSIY